jgi:hypothetical protein
LPKNSQRRLNMKTKIPWAFFSFKRILNILDNKLDF